jgi:hypothetical protein
LFITSSPRFSPFDHRAVDNKPGGVAEHEFFEDHPRTVRLFIQKPPEAAAMPLTTAPRGTGQPSDWAA